MRPFVQTLDCGLVGFDEQLEFQTSVTDYLQQAFYHLQNEFEFAIVRDTPHIPRRLPYNRRRQDTVVPKDSQDKTRPGHARSVRYTVWWRVFCVSLMAYAVPLLLGHFVPPLFQVVFGCDNWVLDLHESCKFGMYNYGVTNHVQYLFIMCRCYLVHWDITVYLR